MPVVSGTPTTETAVSGTWTGAVSALATSDNVKVQNTNAGTKNATSDRRYGGFGFDASVPADAVIQQVDVISEHMVSNASNIATISNLPRIGTTDGTLNSDALEPVADTTRTYANIPRPGGGTWSRADLLNGTFFVTLRASNGNNATAYNTLWDLLRVDVTYIVLDPPIYYLNMRRRRPFQYR